MRKLVVATALILGTLYPLSAWADANWILSATGSNPVQTVYIDTSTIRRNGPVVQYWTKTDYGINKENWKQDITLIETECNTGRSRNLQIMVIYVDGHSGSTNSPGAWRYSIPDSLADKSDNAFCMK